MGRRWQQQLGNTARFAVMIGFDDDPDDGEGATREMAASWGAFQIWVGGQNLCAYIDGGETVTSVHWYLLPMLEWFAEHWQPLLHEEKLPVKNSADGGAEALGCTAFPPVSLTEDAASAWEANWFAWRSRHALEACREGGLFPDVVIRRYRERVEVSWEQARLAGVPSDFRFVSSQGVERLAPNDVAGPLFGVLLAAAQFLADELPNSSRIASLIDRLGHARTAPMDERLAWMVGLGQTWKVMQEAWGQIESKLDRIPRAADALWAGLRGDLVAEGSCQIALMFGSAAPTLDLDDVVELAKRGIDQHEPTGYRVPRALVKLVRDEPAPLGRRMAFEDGYRLADDFLAAMNIDLDKIEQVDIKDLLKRLKIHVGNLSLKDSHIRGVAIAGPRHRPAILVNARNAFNAQPVGQRFTLAHELCHILHDRSAGKELSLISGPWAPLAIERRANAFAAMVLMPVPLVKRAIADLSTREDSADGVRTMAKRLGTSASATVEHVGNLQQWDEATRERVRAELEAD